MMTYIFVLGGLIGVLLFFIYRFCYAPYQVLKRNGIKGPKPSVFYGNYKDWAEMGIVKYLDKLHKEYGPIVGIYRGQTPQISVTDLDLIKLITIKDFDNFINRQPRPRMIRTKDKARGVIHSRDEAWRSQRRILTPTFSTHKLKIMTPLMTSSVRDLVEVFEPYADTNKSAEVCKIFGAYSMETILATCFGRVVAIQKGEQDHLTEIAETIFSNVQEGKKFSTFFFMTLLSNLPWFETVIRYFLIRGNAQAKAAGILGEAARKIVDARIEENMAGKKYKDLLQLMLDATAEDVHGGNGKTKLTKVEVFRNAMTFMMAGYETTASTLSYTAYLLALNPHVQEKLQEEIDAYQQKNPDASLYQSVQDIELLEMVLFEALRIYPPLPLFTRECGKDYKYKDFTIPKGAVVSFPSALIQKDPEYWEDPEKFDPMRFTAEEKAKRPQHTFLPFGSGPRTCIGMRFSLLEAKLGLLEVLKKFSFVRAPDTQVPLETVFGFTVTPKNGIYVKVIARGSNRCNGN